MNTDPQHADDVPDLFHIFASELWPGLLLEQRHALTSQHFSRQFEMRGSNKLFFIFAVLSEDHRHPTQPYPIVFETCADLREGHALLTCREATIGFAFACGSDS